MITNELDNLDKQYIKEVSKSEKVKRNRELPILLKRMYNFKCQLCDRGSGQYSIIEKSNGEEYVEVHHITEISQGKYIDDDSNKEIDSYKNCIVVCCFHHKYLHLHHGGFRMLKYIDGELCFISEMEDVLPIITNYHLDENIIKVNFNEKNKNNVFLNE